MDKKNNITDHSEEKLKIYKEYLRAYLEIMALPVIKYKDIYVIEPFAGCGVSENGKDGSTIIAKNLIYSKLADFKKTEKNIHLLLNELKKSNYDKLCKHVTGVPFVQTSNKDADIFINETEQNILSGHKLYFIDPHGYTQIQKDTYDNYIFNQTNKDIIIFIPIYQIYRFLKEGGTDVQLAPIKEFLTDIGITALDVKNSHDYKVFTETIKRALQKNNKYVSYYLIDNEKANNHYALFFMSNNHLGAEKFLESIGKMKIPQMQLFPSKNEEEFIKMLEYISKKQKVSNRSLYVIGLRNSLLPPDVKRVLETLETNKKIIVRELNGSGNKNSFYIGSKYLGIPPKIEVVWNEHKN
ncbi:MAG: three-Cys-motif partner protein TcmP [Proteobacteria bacterium]|nr:three-Cys-motif partner protein TcmP [Pseudomonadota bacterium]